MPRLFRKRAKKAGSSPGSLVFMGERKAERARITILDYDEAKFEEKEAGEVEECFPFREKPTVTWINIDGLHQTEIISKLGAHFELHPLIMEDILNTDQRPKMEDFGKYLFIVLKMLQYDDRKGISVEQVSIILGSNFVISFQEREGDVFDAVRERIRGGKGKIRKMGPDYLAYALVDAVVDSYFGILEKLGERIEVLEEKVLRDPAPGTMGTIHALKRDMIFMRKAVWPLREVVNGLQRGESKLIQKATVVYLRDVYDHTIQVIDTVETFRDMLSGMNDLYLSSISNRMNEVMKMLTIIATIFIPLTFIAGVYGMNFQDMPELSWKWGYPTVMLLMLLIAAAMVAYFRRKHWL